MDTIKLDTGYVPGTIAGVPGKEARTYRGIPSAAPPIDELRWKPPQPMSPWEGILECIKYSIQAAQYPDMSLPEEDQKEESSEDYLYLNVYTPSKDDTERLPVTRCQTSFRSSHTVHLNPNAGKIAVLSHGPAPKSSILTGGCGYLK